MSSNRCLAAPTGGQLATWGSTVHWTWRSRSAVWPWPGASCASRRERASCTTATRRGSLKRHRTRCERLLLRWGPPRGRSLRPPQCAPRDSPELGVILVIDNYDSFTFNLVQYLWELGAQ